MMGKSRLPIDMLHNISWLTKLNTISVIPSPVLPNDQMPSCIDVVFWMEKTDLLPDAWKREDLQQCVDKIHMVRHVYFRPQAFQAARKVLSVLPDAGSTRSAHPLDLPESPRLNSCHT